jgi:hypothetical protein
MPGEFPGNRFCFEGPMMGTTKVPLRADVKCLVEEILRSTTDARKVQGVQGPPAV